MDATDQQRILDAIAKAAADEGYLVAPVGSVYFLLRGSPRPTTKDVDAVIHGEDLKPPSIEVLQRIAARLTSFGVAQPTTDGAVVQIKREGATAEIELIRGRPGAKGGFFPRELLIAAAKEAKRAGNILEYPVEYVLVLKADAAVDREDRAKRDIARAEAHERRANAFRADVLREVNSALLGDGLSVERVRRAIDQVKASRREHVEALFAAAGFDIRTPARS